MNDPRFPQQRRRCDIVSWFRIICERKRDTVKSQTDLLTDLVLRSQAKKISKDTYKLL